MDRPGVAATGSNCGSVGCGGAWVRAASLDSGLAVELGTAVGVSVAAGAIVGVGGGAVTSNDGGAGADGPVDPVGVGAGASDAGVSVRSAQVSK